ncbi:DUF2065 family protein [Roseivivax isoporae]|uniref:DUF2065 domain-containing protein n=1 Tax=Roseivivax isoporae LMG 25204 TaxID=1449351 RepID=X7F686_9RHOB|nr:DUF2065 family protein [Roseivivax isoporae]ETX28263.1 hypothetical protein RISW2_09130 [Roseivivax isoporae LMG 25204]
MEANTLLVLFAGALIVEGLAWALAPSLLERLLEALAGLPLEARRMLGLLTALTGIAILWVAL